MSDRCEQLHAYVDDELETEQRIAFEAHLATCEACSAELPQLLALLTVLDAAATASTAKGSARLNLVTAPGGSVETVAPAPRRRPRRRRPLWIASGIISLAAMAAALLLFLRPQHTTGPTEIVSLAADLAPTRSLEPRLSYAGTTRHRPLDVARGARSTEAITMDRMSRLERARDWHGVAVAALLAGERDRAQRFFAQAPATPEVDSDRAALELLDGSPAALERALDHVDRALAAAPDNTAALWNRALVLAGLNLPLAAARDLDRVIAAAEPGWADEARIRAAALRAAVQQRRTRWQQANQAGPKLIEDGTPVPAELTSVTGYMTIMLYDAVRAAPSRSRVEALLPLAQTLDAAYRSERLTAYVHRIAASDFRVRKPLADTYRELVAKGSLPDAAVDAFLKRLDQTATTDIWMGAVVRAGRIAAHLDEYRKHAGTTGDPWFALIAEHELAKAEIARGALSTAERRLREAIATSRRELLAYRAILLEDQLAVLLKTLRRLSLADNEAQRGFRDAIAGGDWLREKNAVSELAAINQERYANGLARAYLTELLERSDSVVMKDPTPAAQQYDCARRQYAYQSLANVSIYLRDPDRARSELAAVPPCDDRLTTPYERAMKRGLILRTALVWSDLYRFSHRDEDAHAAKLSLAALATYPEIPAGEQAFATLVEGWLVIDTDRAEGQRLLRAAIAQAAERTDEYSQKARAYAFSLLALDAGQASEFTDVVALLAETLAVTKPERCSIAVAVQEGRSVVAFVDASGRTGGHYLPTARANALDVSTLVPTSIVERLRDCERVTVMSRAPVLGAARLLPPEVAWSYLIKGGPQAATNTEHRLIIANPEVPPELNLPALGPFAGDPNEADVVILRGGDATPTRVLQAMRNASVIEFHTHGFIANDVSEASYLVLAPELDQQYAVTARDVAQVELKAAPLVVLGACHAATSSRSLEGGIGLAEAFLRSGARTVIASPDPVQDLDATSFFTVVRKRVMQGISPAVAVRDERVRRLGASRDDTWASAVVVFE